MQWIKQLFCKHKWDSGVVTSTFRAGSVWLSSGYYTCKKCDKIKES